MKYLNLMLCEYIYDDKYMFTYGLKKTIRIGECNSL